MKGFIDREEAGTLIHVQVTNFELGQCFEPLPVPNTDTTMS